MADIPDYIGNYKLVRELGRGAMGTVYLAHQESLGRDLALKVLAPEFTRDPEFIERFRREGRAAASLRHPNIVRIFDADARDGFYFIAMEYVGEQDLRDVLRSQGRLPTAQAVTIAATVLLALDEAHRQGVVHRDIKPANIMLSGGDVTLTDFSIARLSDDAKLTRTGVMIGTPEYMAPEQFDGLPPEPGLDIYATGVVLYEMLTGEQPFRAATLPEMMKRHIMHTPTNPAELVDEVSPQLGAVVMKALAKSPNERYASAAEMRTALLKAYDPDQESSTLQDFLRSIESGSISMDDAIRAREMVKQAIDRGFKKVLTVMMVDLAGSSKIKQPNQTLIADRAFRDYRATINQLLGEHGCERYDWSGDGAICLFDDALAAVAAASKIQQAIETVGDRHRDLPGRLRARIGVHTGEVYLDPRRSLGEFASRTVDCAGHLEKDCPVGLIHVSEATMELTKHQFNYKYIGKNRDDLSVYEIDPAADRRVEAPVPAVAPSAPVAQETRPMAGAALQAPSAHIGPETVVVTQGFLFWWGVPLGFVAFLLQAVGVLLSGTESGQVCLGIGMLTAMLLLLACPLCLGYYLPKKRYSAAGQAAATFVVLIILEALILKFLV